MRGKAVLASPSILPIVLASLVLHGLVAILLVLLPKRAPEKVSVVVTLRSSPPKPAPPIVAPPAPAPTPAPTPMKVASHVSHTAAPSAPAAPSRPAPRSSAPAAPDFGLSMAGGGGGSMPVPAGSPGGAGHEAAAPRQEPAKEASCAPPTKAKAIEVPQPVYPESEREEATEGKVRVEIELDATGAVVNARVLQSLSPAFDAAALEAARQARFEPATECGHPAATKFTLSIRFQI